MTTMMSNNTKEFQYQSMKSSKHNTKLNPPPPYNYPDAGVIDDDDNDDALSFCDLSIYNDESADSLRKGGRGISTDDRQNQRSSFDNNSNKESDRFEFFTSEFVSAQSTPETVVFCGRMITTSDTRSEQMSGFSDQKRLDKRGGGRKYGGILQWIIPNRYSSSLHQHKSTKPVKTAVQPVNNYITTATKDHVIEKQSKGNVNINTNNNTGRKLTSSSSSRKSPAPIRSKPTMSTCSVIGFVRFPSSDMNLDEIKSRQARRSPRTYLELYEEEQRRMRNRTTMMTTVKTGAGFVGMMRSLSCRACRTF